MKYLAVLSVLFFVGCATVSDSSSTSGGGNGYRDYTYTKDGVVMIHRVYSEDRQEWLTQEAAAK